MLLNRIFEYGPGRMNILGLGHRLVPNGRVVVVWLNHAVLSHGVLGGHHNVMSSLERHASTQVCTLGELSLEQY